MAHKPQLAALTTAAASITEVIERQPASSLEPLNSRGYLFTPAPAPQRNEDVTHILSQMQDKAGVAGKK